ncbi:hypothetical protein Pla108_23430 [Botrimarina colliarenosi]|uniref:Bacterial Ig-like domain (Group 2) n=1 Tax=Botrimarina colliarenosi TaxID=2528001 RepID=A0A5C6AFI0_9BACT|nr:DUF1549 domain-containing protein [Botrimarina colliarenosi]TWT98186.1 hypothetical protein Pla108_23430 [Botrimarina colliarenosi]
MKPLAYPCLLALSLSLCSAVGSADEASPTEFVDLTVYPPQVTLNHADDFQRVVAVATQADGVTIDVTDLASWRVGVEHGDAEAVRLEDGLLSAESDGVARVAVEFAGLHAEADVHAEGIAKERPISFRHDVIPVLTRAGCNSGGCHGSSRGKDGFRLSLFGFDPAGDHHRLTREQVNRRLNLALPEESLLLTKAVASVTHTGGKRFDDQSEYYAKLADWIAAGAPNDLDGAPTVTAVALYPPRAAIGAGGQSQRFIAVADYSDGTSRDVTSLAIFQSSNESSAAIDQTGKVTSDRRGETFVTARFDTHTVGSQVLVLPTDEPFEPRPEAPVNYVDEFVNAKLRTLRIHPSELCADNEFLRRATIDIAGRLPTPEEAAAFAADDSAAKRETRIDALLKDPGFAQVWGLKWAELLLVRTLPNRVEYKPMFLYSRWLTEQIDSGRPLDEMVRDLLAASGSSFDTPQVNFYQIEPDPKKIAENVAQTFCGIRLQCAQCHNHPFDRWTMDDYYAFTAFFAQIQRKAGEDYREVFLFNRGSGEAKHPVDNRNMKPKYLGGAEADVKGRDRREALAEWVTAPENPYFAPSVANRVWAHFFGVGVVEPVDDLRVSNPPSNPALFKALGERLVEYDYDLRRLVRDVTLSNAYQRSCEPNTSNQGDLHNFARAHARRLPAETLLDCLSQVTGAPEKLPNLPLGARATQIADGNAGNYFLTTFGRSKRETVCACEAKSDPTLSQALHLLNGATVAGKIDSGKQIERWLDDGKTPAEVVDAIYSTALSRPANEQERADLLAMIGDAERPVEQLRDVFWAVLNSREFAFNH